jgi:hypothetical protein
LLSVFAPLNIAVQAELDSKKKRRPDRATNNGSWPKERAIGALQEAETADQERYIVVPRT